MSSSVTGKNKTNASATIIFLFIFLSKPNIILMTPDIQHLNGKVSTSNGSLGCSSYEGGGVNKYFGNAESTLAGVRGETFTKIKAYAGMAEQQVRDLEIEEALQDEIKDTLKQNNQSYVNRCALSDKGENKNKVKLTVTYAMGWQNRSSGRRYDCSTRHAFIIGGIIKGVIGMVLYSKACRKCDAA